MTLLPLLTVAGKVATETYSEFAPFQLDRSTAALERRYTNDVSEFINVNDARIHYRDEGPRDAPTVVALHGSYSSLHTWDNWVEQLCDDVRIVRLDMPGHGLTGPRKQGRHTLQALIDTVGAFCDELGLSEVVLAGNSLGGGVAWRLATHRPELVSKLLLLNAGGATLLSTMERNLTSVGTSLVPRYATPRLLVRLLLLDAYHDSTMVTGDLVRRYHDLLLHPGNRRAVVELAENYMQDHFDEERYDLINAGLPSLPSAAHDPSPVVWDSYDIATVSAPTLFQWGAADTWLPLTFGRELAENVPDRTFITYENVGHVPMEEAPELTAADAVTFIHSGQSHR